MRVKMGHNGIAMRSFGVTKTSLYKHIWIYFRRPIAGKGHEVMLVSHHALKSRFFPYNFGRCMCKVRYF